MEHGKGRGYFLYWPQRGGGGRYAQGPGQLEHLWILELDGARLVVGASYFPATSAADRDELWPHHKAMHDRIGRQRGWPPMTREQFDLAAGPDGALAVGSPETVAAKIVRAVTGLGAARYDLKYSAGTLPHPLMLRSIELYATEVAPIVREQLASEAAA